jgi:nitrate/nitrite-specific signal transduction histidine kinase
LETELEQYHKNLEERVKEKTNGLEVANQKLQEKIDDIEYYHDLFVKREFRIKELRDLVKIYEDRYGKIELA